MGRTLRAIWQGIVDAYNELFPIVGMNLLWLVFSIPLALIGLLLIQAIALSLSLDDDLRQALSVVFSGLYAILLVVGPNPASAGIHLWANRLVKDERVEFSLFWEGLRTYLGKSLLLFAIAGIVLLLLIANAMFYLSSELIALRIFGIAWLYAVVLWMSMQLYVLPLLIEQGDKSVRLVLRNSFFLTLAQILPTLVLLAILSVLVVISIGLTLLIALLTASVSALITTRVVHSALERYRPASSQG